MVESKKALPKEPRTVGMGLGVGIYSSMSPPHTLTSPGRFGNNNNNVLYNRFNALSQYYNTQGQTEQYDRYVNFDSVERQDNYNDSHYSAAQDNERYNRYNNSGSRFAGYFQSKNGNNYNGNNGNSGYNGNGNTTYQRNGENGGDFNNGFNIGDFARQHDFRTNNGFINENGGIVSDYINTAIQGHYDTDFPELTSKFENFSLGTNDNQDLF